MKKTASILFAGLMVILLSTTAWADLDPRADFGVCGYTSVEETWEPDAAGTLVKRVTYVSQCDTPSATDETITITTEELIGGSLETTEVREAVRTVTGNVYTTTTDIYGPGMALAGMEVHTFDEFETDSNIWFQDWTYYVVSPARPGSGMDLVGYTTRITELLGGDEREVTFVYYDQIARVDPVIPDDVPVLGTTTASAPILPPLNKNIDIGNAANLGRMYTRVRNALIINPNTQSEGNVFLRDAGTEPVSHLCTPPSGLYVAAVLKGDRFDDPGIFNGYFHRWVKWLNTPTGDLDVQFGWTSDRDLNEPTSDWWQARVRQDATGAIESIENAHRSGETYEDHYDTFTVLNSMFMIDSQTVKMFDFDGGYPGNFTETTTVTNGMAAPVSYKVWTVVYD